MLALHEMNRPTRKAVLEEMKRVLKTEGHILLIDFHVGHAQFIKGWLIKPIIFLSEVAAGRRHFRNYRHFKSIRGLPRLIEESKFSLKKSKVVAGGTMALYLVRTEKSPM